MMYDALEALRLLPDCSAAPESGPLAAPGSPMQSLLIIDDEPNVLYSLQRGLRRDGLEIRTAGTADEGLRAIEEDLPDAVLMDVQMPGRSGLDALEEIRRINAHVPVILMTAHGTADTAIEAMKRGAFDYILKPWKLADLRALVDRALNAGRLSRVPAVFGEDDTESESEQSLDVDRIVGRSPAMQSLFKEIGRVAPQNINVLIRGESGTGKELVARAIYHHSQRTNQPFLAINCAALPDTLLESELFGHEQGALTGADRRRIGKFEQADGGTLFLDEVGDMSPLTQGKVLRVLEDGRFQRVGGTETITVDVRLLAATNRDLEELIREKRFRQDLYYRLNTYELTLPPLRERREDIPLLVRHFLRRSSRDFQAPQRGISPAALKALEEYHWPGNVRELESAIRYALVRSAGETIKPEDLPASIVPSSESPAVPTEPASAEEQPSDDALSRQNPSLADAIMQLLDQLLPQSEGAIYEDVHSAVDRILLAEVLRRVDGHQTRAAELLGISRTTLRAKLQQLGMSVEKIVR